MTFLSSVKYGNNGYDYPKSLISASTRRKLESLGIDPALVTSETQALSMIAERQSEKSFEQYAVQNKPQEQTNLKTHNSDSSTTDAELYSAMSLQAHNTRYMLGL